MYVCAPGSEGIIHKYSVDVNIVCVGVSATSREVLLSKTSVSQGQGRTGRQVEMSMGGPGGAIRATNRYEGNGGGRNK